jgi:hypothetical protein
VEIHIGIGLGIDLGMGVPVPICPPYCVPVVPLDVVPCPSLFETWCWYPGFNQCYGYTNGVGLPLIQEQVVVAQLPVVEVVTQRTVVQIVPGTTVQATLTANTAAGQVLVQYGDVALPAEVVDWQNEAVTFIVPAMALKAPVSAELIFVNSRGELIEQVACQLVAATVVATAE